MDEFCPMCNCKLMNTTFGNRICPIHGKLEDNNYEEDSKGEKSYIG